MFLSCFFKPMLSHITYCVLNTFPCFICFSSTSIAGIKNIPLFLRHINKHARILYHTPRTFHLTQLRNAISFDVGHTPPNLKSRFTKTACQSSIATVSGVANVVVPSSVEYVASRFARISHVPNDCDIKRPVRTASQIQETTFTINALWIIMGMFAIGILGAWSGFLG